MASRPVGVALAVLLVSLPAACGPDARRAAATPNVVVIVLDALRPDRLGCYGNQSGLTPFLDEWAEHGWVFHRAHTAASYTIPSVASLFTSRLLGQHGVEWFNSVLPGEEVTLTEVLHERGYATGAFTASLFFKGFDQGFDLAKVVASTGKGPPRADELGAAARTFLADRKQPRPVFLYFHLVESHVPWDLPPPDRAPRYRREQAPDEDRAMKLYLDGAAWPLAADELAEVEDAYDGGIVVMDARLRALFAELRELGVLDDALVVILADHGDDFGEHGNVGHAKTLYETSTRIPLLVRLPGQSQRVDAQRVVSSIDVAPTILDQLHIAPPKSFEGHSLLAAPPGLWQRLTRTGPPGGDAGAAYSQFNVPSLLPLPPWHRAAVVLGSHKLLVAADGTRAYYDLAADAGETKPDALGAADRGRLDQLLSQVPARKDGARGAAKVELDAPAKERLKSLGYIQ